MQPLIKKNPIQIFRTTLFVGTEEELSDKHSSEDETEVLEDVWTISPEQCTYYINQFTTLQSDLTALLPGPIARTFFEKSRLPVHTLRKIWQLADVTKDGALSLQEFMTAMHLVVLKRNNIEIPDVLPPGGMLIIKIKILTFCYLILN